MGELPSWKPTSRGAGACYGGYDFVGSAMRDGESKLSLAKLMGATIDVSADDDPGIADGTTSFGLWTNEGEVPEDVFNDSQSPVIDLFDGQTLTVTVTFEDGSTSTQAIELHVANFETEMVDGAPRLTPRLAADDAEASTSAKSLYGTVVEAGNGPFPFPLDDANDRADEVLPASIIERQDDTWRATVEVDGAHVDATLPENALTAADGEIPFDFGYENPDYSYTNAESPQRLTAQLAMSSPSLSLSDTLPGGKTLGDCLFVIGGWLGNARYLDKCSREVWGYGYNDDGTLTSNDYRYASTTVTVRNLGDTAVPVWTSVLYEFALRNDDGTLDVVRTGYDLDFEASGDTLPSDNPQHVVIAPGGTVQLTMVRVLPTYVLESDNLVLVPTDNGSLFSHAFALGRQMSGKRKIARACLGPSVGRPKARARWTPSGASGQPWRFARCAGQLARHARTRPADKGRTCKRLLAGSAGRTCGGVFVLTRGRACGRRGTSRRSTRRTPRGTRRRRRAPSR